MRYAIPQEVIEKTFAGFRACGRGRRECQLLWVSPWSDPGTITDVVHPEHAAHAGGFAVDSRWLSTFWLTLARQNQGIRVQVHTHPGAAFHSATDDGFPIIHTAGFLSLVIPDYGLGPAGFAAAYLAEIGEDGRWHEVPVSARLALR